jgi:hypothetical protein
MKRRTSPFVFSTLAALGLALSGCSEAPLAPQLSADLDAPAFQENTPTGDPLASTSTVFPSTNEANLGLGWAHVTFADVGVGTVTLDLNQPRTFLACFEFRIDDEAPSGNPNFNTDVTDGLWDFICLNAESSTETFSAVSHVDVRMAFGAEKDERFDWTRFYVLSIENKDQCRDGAWEALGFRNLGQCVRFVETGKDSRSGG